MLNIKSKDEIKLGNVVSFGRGGRTDTSMDYFRRGKIIYIHPEKRFVTLQVLEVMMSDGIMSRLKETYNTSVYI